ncbi:hypothetical protein SM40611_18380 [Xanthomonas hortorum pv. gardneri]|nr:hypothetical protein SM40611_18380 [Xanthomonas hortorum pv. gardneri]
MAGEEAPPERFGGGAAVVFVHGPPVSRALRTQRLEPHGIGNQCVGQVLCWLLAARGQQQGQQRNRQDGSASHGRLRQLL